MKFSFTQLNTLGRLSYVLKEERADGNKAKKYIQRDC